MHCVRYDWQVLYGQISYDKRKPEKNLCRPFQLLIIKIMKIIVKNWFLFLNTTCSFFASFFLGFQAPLLFYNLARHHSANKLYLFYVFFRCFFNLGCSHITKKKAFLVKVGLLCWNMTYLDMSWNMKLFRRHWNCYKENFIFFLQFYDFDDKKINKSNFYKNKKLFKIDEINVNRKLVSKKEPYCTKESIK